MCDMCAADFLGDVIVGGTSWCIRCPGRKSIDFSGATECENCWETHAILQVHQGVCRAADTYYAAKASSCTQCSACS